MKKFVLILTVFFVVFSTILLSQSTYRELCTTDYSQPNGPCYTPWTGPKYDTLCTNNDLNFLNCNLPLGEPCCFIIQYYDRIVRCNNIPEFYDVQITMVSGYAGCQNCYNSNNDTIINWFKMKKYQQVADTFINSRQGNPVCIISHHQTSVGRCFIFDGSQIIACSDPYCCAQYDQICYDRFTGLIIPNLTFNNGKSLFRNDGVPFQCASDPANCENGTIKCNQNLYQIRYKEDDDCLNMPCPFGEWQNSSITINMDSLGCNGCSITVYYRHRETQDCEPGYKDYYLDSCTLTPACITCTLYNTADVFKYAIQSILKYGENGLPERGVCDTTYRVANASCWTTLLENANCRTLDPCPVTGCCWAKYKLCRDSLDRVSVTRLDRYYYDSTYCWVATRPCEFVCDYTPVPKISWQINSDDLDNNNQKLTEIRPNPSSGKVELYMMNNQKGDLRIEIINKQGLKIKVINEKLSGELKVIDLELNELSNGVYFINIYINGKFIDRNKFLLIK